MDAQRRAGIAYLVYFILAFAGQGLGSTALSIAGTVWYFVLAVFLYVLLRSGAPRIAWLLLPLVALGCVFQGVGQIEQVRDFLVVAILFFGAALIVLGYLVTRSTLPTPLGIALALAGVGWFVSVVPGLPLALAAGLQLFGALCEIALMIVLLL